MTKTILLGTIIASVFVIAMITSPLLAFAVGHLIITEAEAEEDDGLWEVEIEASADIPTDGSAMAFGYGVVGTTGILVATTHAHTCSNSRS